MLAGQVEVGDDVFLQPFARRQAVVIEVGDDIFQIAHHVLECRTDELFLGAEVVAHGGDIDAGCLGDGADCGFLEALLLQDVNRGLDHLFTDALALAGQFSHHSVVPFLRFMVF